MPVAARPNLTPEWAKVGRRWVSGESRAEDMAVITSAMVWTGMSPTRSRKAWQSLDCQRGMRAAGVPGVHLMSRRHPHGEVSSLRLAVKDGSRGSEDVSIRARSRKSQAGTVPGGACGATARAAVAIGARVTLRGRGRAQVSVGGGDRQLEGGDRG